MQIVPRFATNVYFNCATGTVRREWVLARPKRKDMRLYFGVRKSSDHHMGPEHDFRSSARNARTGDRCSRLSRKLPVARRYVCQSSGCVHPASDDRSLAVCP